MCCQLADSNCFHTGRIGREPEAPSGRRVLGVFWRCPAALWGPLASTPNPTQVSWKTLILKNWLIFPASCGYVVVLPHVAQVRFWRPKCLIRNKDMPFGNPPHHGTKDCGLLKIDFILIFCLSWVKKWCFGSKKRWF